MLRKSLALLSILCLPACADVQKERLKETIRPTYDPATGRLKELEYDSNKDGRIDTWTEMDGTTPVRSRLDLDGDGRIDRWEYYDGTGVLAKVGFSRNDDGKPDAWAFSRADGKVDRIEISSKADENSIDRWEHYDPSRVGLDGRGALVRAEEDTTGNGAPDKWETYEGGAIKAVSFDENGNGQPDRRLTYSGSTLILIESEPDASGRYRQQVAVKQQRAGQ